MLGMQTNRQRPPEYSARILDSYVAGLRAEVSRLSLVREHSKDVLWLAQLDHQIKLKLQLIDEVSYCLGEDDEDESPTEIEYDSLPGICSAMPSNT
jgi:hypothetical protein